MSAAPLKILFVDDDALARKVVARQLAALGHEVTPVSSGPEALDSLDDEVELLISDVRMPGMEGPELARRAREQRPDIPILFITGFADHRLLRAMEGLNCHMLPKPFDRKQLSAAVDEAVALEPPTE
jgi:two-component system, cell cycle sensor histidine kinase and response regulator CckA